MPSQSSPGSLQKSIERNPQRAISYLSRCLAYRDKENYDRAIIDVDRAIQLELPRTKWLDYGIHNPKPRNSQLY